MHNLSEENLTTEEARVKTVEHFGDKLNFVSLVLNNMDKKSTELKWHANVDSLYNNF